jgi:DNA-binding response OmpR family regulator
MTQLPIVFWGEDGLETQVFRTYMQSFGHPVSLVNALEPALKALAVQPSAVLVIAADQSASRFKEWVRTVRARTRSISPIFVLNGWAGFEMNEKNVFVLTRPFRLKELTLRIQRLSRGQR